MSQSSDKDGELGGGDGANRVVVDFIGVDLAIENLRGHISGGSTRV